MGDPERLRERFVEYCEIASPTGSERAMADRVAADLRAAGLTVTEDEAAGPARAGAGNLIARLPPAGRPIPGAEPECWVMLGAHLDTVPHSEPIRVVRDGDTFGSAGETILGADNKAAVAVLVELAIARAEAARAAEAAAAEEEAAGALFAGDESPAQAAGLELVFTVAEEDGLRGAKALDPGELRSRFGFVLDHASPIGEVIVAAPTHLRFRAEFEGRESHAGIKPEEGSSAIRAAAVAIARIEEGRLDPSTTANIGRIGGGTATNVVPGSCTFTGEVRSLDPERVAAYLSEVTTTCAEAAEAEGCELRMGSEEIFKGYRLNREASSLRVAEAALVAIGAEPVPRPTGGGSDASALIAQGFECLLLANGTEANHTSDESVTGENLDRALALCEALAERAVAEC